MTDILTTKIEDYAVDWPMNGGMSGVDKLGESAISVEGAWLVQSLQDLVKSGEYAGVTMNAADAILMVADKIETDGIAPEGQKAVADLLRYLAQFALVRPVPMS
ncbi:hypothetical protein [Agrobacterium sp.]|uniref:hypothetical protein n=1 Tax=Agrobacterium sp. TaxID=361 RepID=UPI00289675E7|nr:hypothetical protein [Agrobacterium sp.]